MGGGMAVESLVGASVLLIVPSLVHVAKYAVFADYGFLVLDDILDSGSAGVFFRRLRLTAAVDPSMRVKYDELRHAYLQSVLPIIIAGQRRVVVVGTHPTDVDLVEFDSVEMLDISESGLRMLSVDIYGEPVMLATEYAQVGRLVAESVDKVHTIADWDLVAAWLPSHFKPSVVGYVRLPEPLVKRRLSAVTSTSSDMRAMLAPGVDFSDDEHAQQAALIFDYVSVIKEEWRDPVVGVLGAAPSIDIAFRLPWYVVEPGGFSRMCYRTNQRGVPAMSLRGESLVDLVTNRMAGAFSSGQLVGTWVGAVLCDRVIAMQAAQVLRGKVMVPTVEVDAIAREGGSVNSLQPSYVVTDDCFWAYAACPGVISVADSMALAELVDGGVMREPPSLRLIKAFAYDELDAYARLEVVAFVRRVHALGDNVSDFLGDLERVWKVAWIKGSLSSSDQHIVHLLPGLTYLSHFSESFRGAALDVLGVFPKLLDCKTYVRANVAVGGDDLIEQLRHAAVRTSIMSGRVVGELLEDELVVGDGDAIGAYMPGYCYLEMFKPVYHPGLRSKLGEYPTYKAVMSVPVTWRIDDYATKVKVTVSYSCVRGYVLHFNLVAGYPLESFIHAKSRIGFLRLKLLSFVGCRIGGDASGKWFVIAIVSLTVSVVYTLLALAWIIYKCRGQSRGGSRGGGMRYR